ncbi:MAG: hypothetical protein LC744_03540 [Chloroflexi bacterium]|nr:hypothetical protein [Chloroflexota bacterium]
MTGLFDGLDAAEAATWVAALVTIVVLGGLMGERRAFGWSQHLLAGLATGFMGLLAIREVIVPRLVDPLLADPGNRVDLWVGLGLLGLAAGAPWLPRPITAVPLSIAIGSLAAFALGGAVVGTLLPQLATTMARPGGGLAGTALTVASAAVSGLVLVSFLHGAPRGQLLGAAAGAGRWLLVAGLGGWLGYLLLSRLVLLMDRIGFLLGDWLGIGL